MVIGETSLTKTTKVTITGNDENEADLVFVICRRRVYFHSQFAYCLHTHQTYLILGPEISEDTLSLAE